MEEDAPVEIRKEESTPAPELSLVTVVEIGERQFVLNPTSGNTYLEYNSWLRRNPELATTFLIGATYTVDGQPLTQAEIRSLNWRDRLKLTRVFSSIDNQVTINDGAKTFEDSSDFTVGTKRIQALPIPGEPAVTIATGLSEKPSSTLKEVMIGYYRVDGAAITEELLDLPYPKGIGFTVTAAIANHLVAPFVSSQSVQI